MCRILFTHFVSACIIALRSEIARGKSKRYKVGWNGGRFPCPRSKRSFWHIPAVWSPYSLYREDIATFAAGGDYKQSDATGFISIYDLPTKVQAIVNNEKEGK